MLAHDKTEQKMNTTSLLAVLSLSVFSQLSHSENAFTESFSGSPQINTNIYVFAADISGSIGEKIAGQPINYQVDQPFDETVKHLNQAFMGYIDFRKGDWGVYIDKQYVKTSEKDEVLDIPLAVQTKLDQTSYGIYYQAYKSPTKNAFERPKVIFEPTIGVHHTEAKAKLAANVLGSLRTVQADVNWNEFFWGARFRYNFNSPWNIASEVTVGENDTLSAHAYVGYNIPVYKRIINLRAGYRYFHQDHTSGNFNWDITEKGPVVGFNIPIF